MDDAIVDYRLASSITQTNVLYIFFTWLLRIKNWKINPSSKQPTVQTNK